MGNVVEEWLKFLEMNMMGLSRESCMLGYLGIFCFCYVVGRLKYKKKRFCLFVCWFGLLAVICSFTNKPVK